MEDLDFTRPARSEIYGPAVARLSLSRHALLKVLPDRLRFMTAPQK